MTQDAGFLVVLRPEVMVERYEAQMPEEWQPEYSAFRRAIPGVDPRAYRGMSRTALDIWPSHDPDAVEAFRGAGVDMDSDRGARIRLLEQAEQTVGTPLPAEYEEGLLPSRELAEEVLQLVDVPEEWELVFVSRSEVMPSFRTMGIDIGWWGSAFYSIIWDSLVCPTWHGPPTEAWLKLAEWSDWLNQHVMFDDLERANEFVRWYESEPWAERNGFISVRVDKVM
jgi:hypothetical protein